MGKERLPFIKLYPGDWLSDDISGCSLAAQALWLRMMFIMHNSERYGYLAVNGSPMQPVTVAQRCGCDQAQYETLLAELIAAGVPSVAEDGTIFSRRMVRDYHQRQLGAVYGKKGGNPSLKPRQSVGPLTGGLSPPDNPPLTVNMNMVMGGGVGEGDDAKADAAARHFLDATGLAFHFPKEKLAEVKALLRIKGAKAAQQAVNQAYAKGIGGQAAVTYAAKILASDAARQEIRSRTKRSAAVREDV